MIETCYRTRDGQVFNRIETARRQETLLDALESSRAANMRANLQQYLAYCDKHGLCPDCNQKYAPDGDCGCDF